MNRSPGRRAIEELGRDEIDELLRGQLVGRIGCHADGVTYVVPVIHAYDGDGIYVASVEGQKVRMMRQNPNVCYEVDEYRGAGGWRSAIVQGVYEELDAAGSKRALELLGERFPGRDDRSGERRRSAAGQEPVCFRIRVQTASGRSVC